MNIGLVSLETASCFTKRFLMTFLDNEVYFCVSGCLVDALIVRKIIKSHHYCSKLYSEYGYENLKHETMIHTHLYIYRDVSAEELDAS